MSPETPMIPSQGAGGDEDLSTTSTRQTLVAQAF